MLTRALFIAWVATLGADRIDLLGGAGPAMLLPFHVLTALLLPVVWWPFWRDARWPSVPPRAPMFAGLVLLLITAVTFSVLRSADVTLAAGRSVLFVAAAVGVSAVLWAVASRDDLPKLLGLGAQCGLLLAVAANIAQLANFVGLLPNDVELGPLLLRVEMMRYGILPRLSGAAYDMNRGAMLAVAFGGLVALAPAAMRGRRAWVGLAALMALASLSRSAILAAIPVVMLTPGLLPSLRQEPRAARRTVALGLGGVAVLAALLLHPGWRQASQAAVAPLGARVSLQDASAGIHGELFVRALEVATRDGGNAVAGIGYGMSFRVLADVFGSNRYGNFHSTWLQLWVEAGIMALIVGLCLSLVPLGRAVALRGLLLGLAIFNTFYSFTADPMWWLFLSLAWLAPVTWRMERA